MTTLTRLPDWQQRFGDLVAQRMAMPFTWGQFDCVMWAADAVQAITGHDFADGMRGTYSTERQALRILKPLGGVAALASERLSQRPLAMVRCGDVGLLDSDTRPTLVVYGGAHWLAATAKGLWGMPSERVSQAWSCEHA